MLLQNFPNLLVHTNSADEAFYQSGFKVPDDVTDLTGVKGFVDFQGDYGAHLTFSVRPDQIDTFLHLPPKYWLKPSDFKQLEAKTYCGGMEVPAGSYMIKQEGPGEIRREYAVNTATKRIYFSRSSW